MPKAGISQAEYEARERFKKKKAAASGAAAEIASGTASVPSVVPAAKTSGTATALPAGNAVPAAGAAGEIATGIVELTPKSGLPEAKGLDAGGSGKPVITETTMDTGTTPESPPPDLEAIDEGQGGKPVAVPESDTTPRGYNSMLWGEIRMQPPKRYEIPGMDAEWAWFSAPNELRNDYDFMMQWDALRAEAESLAREARSQDLTIPEMRRGGLADLYRKQFADLRNRQQSLIDSFWTTSNGQPGDGSTIYDPAREDPDPNPTDPDSETPIPTKTPAQLAADQALKDALAMLAAAQAGDQGTGAAQAAVNAAMSQYLSVFGGNGGGSGWTPPVLSAAEREASGGGTTATDQTGLVTGDATTGQSDAQSAADEIAAGSQQQTALPAVDPQQEKIKKMGDLGRQLQEAVAKGDMIAVGKINAEMTASLAVPAAAGTQMASVTDPNQAAGGGGVPVADGGSTGGGTEATTAGTDFGDLLNKIKNGVGVTPNDVPTGLTQELLDSIMKQSPELTPEQRAVIERDADEAMASALSALSARGIGLGSDAAKALVYGEFQKKSMIAAEQARIRSENTRNALAAAGLSIENLKNAQGYSMQQRLATLQETLGIADIVQKQQDSAARANEFAQTFGLDQAKFGEAVRQYDKSFGLDEAKFEEIKKQFADTFGLDTEKFKAAVDQFEKTFGLDKDKLAEAKREFEAEYLVKVEDQAFMHALQTGQLSLEAIRVDNSQQLALIQEANDVIQKTADRDLEERLGISKLQLTAMLSGREMDISEASLGLQKWMAQMGYQVDLAKIEAGLEGQIDANRRAGDANANAGMWQAIGLFAMLLL